MLNRLKEYAINNNIPIMEEEGIVFLTTFIKDNQVKNILEIGSAIGYSAINMALVDKDIIITTVERDTDRYLQAVKNIKKFNLKDRIKIIEADALDIVLEDKYDLIFIDAAKSQYIKFFEKFKNNLNDNGFIVTDNLKFHGLTNNVDIIKSRNLRALVRKINNYVVFLKNNQEFITEFIDIGDGISISQRNK
ncbi:MAG: O-methyltransferase [Bacilli bacterium]|nr:O-methyltransferase [Bacilli bacterium]MDD4282887.1 O-methyltransferase [Bacilli bacterium]MDD4718733.1 O-methyltransferase [Bacilli bacterium]